MMWEVLIQSSAKSPMDAFAEIAALLTMLESAGPFSTPFAPFRAVHRDAQTPK
jgi:hypothetical protein